MSVRSVTATSSQRNDFPSHTGNDTVDGRNGPAVPTGSPPVSQHDGMWDERISVVRAFADAITERDVGAAIELCHPEIEFFSLLAQLEASPYRGFAGIRRYFKDIDATWEEWRVDVEQLLSAPDGRVAI